MAQTTSPTTPTTPTTAATLGKVLDALAESAGRRDGHVYCGWLPLCVHHRGHLPVTPRRLAWALRQIAASGYAGRCVVGVVDVDAATAASVVAILSRR